MYSPEGVGTNPIHPSYPWYNYYMYTYTVCYILDSPQALACIYTLCYILDSPQALACIYTLCYILDSPQALACIYTLCYILDSPQALACIYTLCYILDSPQALACIYTLCECSLRMSQALVEGDVHLILFTLLYRDPERSGPSRNQSTTTDISTMVEEDEKDSEYMDTCTLASWQLIAGQ